MRPRCAVGGMVLGLLPCAPLWSVQDGEAMPAGPDMEQSVPAASDEPETSPSVGSDQLFGDWGGWRSELATSGITLGIQWTQHVQGVVDGGVKRTPRYGGALDYLVQLDLGAMDLLPGGFLKVLAESRYGDSVNLDAGTLLPVNADLSFPLTDNPDDNVAIAVTELSYTQFLTSAFGVVLGKFQTLDGDPNEFASGRGRSQFLNANFIFNPVTSLTVPYSTLGAGVLWMPSPQWTVSSLVYSTTDSSTTTGFGDVGDGWTWSTEAQFQYRLGDLPGGQNLGFIYAADNEFLNFTRIQLIPGQPIAVTEDDTWAVYWSAWQYLHTPDPAPDQIDVADGRPDLRGVGLFARLGFADGDTNPIEWTASLGLGGRGLLPGRDEDSFGLGFGYADIDRTPIAALVGFAEEGYGMEAFYNVSLMRGVNLTFDAQVLESAIDATDTATILGARLNIRF